MGADVSMLAKEFWLKEWSLEPSRSTLQGIGHAISERSACILKWTDQEGHSGHFQPYMLRGLPTHLWGRDVLQIMGAVLTTQTLKHPNSPVNQMMLDMGWAGNQVLGLISWNKADLPQAVQANVFLLRIKRGHVGSNKFAALVLNAFFFLSCPS